MPCRGSGNNRNFRRNKNEGLDLASFSEFTNKYVQKSFVPSKGRETLAGLTSYLGQVSSLVLQGIIIAKLQPCTLSMSQEGHFHEQLFLKVVVSLDVQRTQLPTSFQLISELFSFRCLWKQTKHNDRVKQEILYLDLKIAQGVQVNEPLRQINGCESGLVCTMKWFVSTITQQSEDYNKNKANIWLQHSYASNFAYVCETLISKFFFYWYIARAV